MKLGPAAGWVAAALAVAAPAAAKPQRVMTINACADLMVLELVPKARVASVTYRARDAARSVAPGIADGIPENDGRPEEVVYFHPDLIVAGRFTTTRTKALARRVGVPVVELDDAAGFADIRTNLRRLGAALGEPARAEALIARMDATLARLAARPPARRLTVAAWTGGPVVEGSGSLTDAIIAAAGARNLGARRGAAGYQDFDLEGLLVARPDALLQPDPRLDQPSVRGGQGRSALVRRLYAGRTVAAPDTPYACGLPESADAAVALRAALAAIPATPVRP